jgi:hypothetical protein
VVASPRSDLDELVARAIRDGIDLKLLTHAIEEARQGVAVARQGRLPSFSATLEATGTSSRTRHGSTRNVWSADPGLEASWEADLWGKLRQRSAAAKVEVAATEAEWRAGYLVLVSEVATSYLYVRLYDEQQTIRRPRSRSAKSSVSIESSSPRDWPRRDRGPGPRSSACGKDRGDAAAAGGGGQRPRRAARGAAGDLRFAGGTAASACRCSLSTDGIARTLEQRPDVVAADQRGLPPAPSREGGAPQPCPRRRGGIDKPRLAVDVLRAVRAQDLVPALDPRTKIKVKLSEIGSLPLGTSTCGRSERCRGRRRHQNLRSSPSDRARAGAPHALDRARDGVGKPGGRQPPGRGLRSRAHAARRRAALLELHAQVLFDTVALFAALGGGF